MGKLFSKSDQVDGSSSKIETIIGPDSVFQGILFLKNTVCVEGNFKGKIESKSSVIVGKNGLVEADIVANHVLVNGEVTGSISALQQLDIGTSGKVRGDVEAKVVTIEKGGLLQGYCRMLAGAEEEDDDAGQHQRRLEGYSQYEATGHLLDEIVPAEVAEEEN